MPIVTVYTNVQRSALPENFLKKFSKHVAEATERDEKFIFCTLLAGQDMMRGGTDAPCGIVHIRNTQTPEVDGRRECAKKITSFFKTELNLSDDDSQRFAVIFEKPARDMIGTIGGLLSDR